MSQNNSLSFESKSNQASIQMSLCQGPTEAKPPPSNSSWKSATKALPSSSPWRMSTSQTSKMASLPPTPAAWTSAQLPVSLSTTALLNTSSLHPLSNTIERVIKRSKKMPLSNQPWKENLAILSKNSFLLKVLQNLNKLGNHSKSNLSTTFLSNQATSKAQAVSSSI